MSTVEKKAAVRIICEEIVMTLQAGGDYASGCLCQTSGYFGVEEFGTRCVSFLHRDSIRLDTRPRLLSTPMFKIYPYNAPHIKGIFSS
jgi:hypothetical protein